MQQLRQVNQTTGVHGYSYRPTCTSMSGKYWISLLICSPHRVSHIWFPVGYKCPIPTPVANNHASALQHPHDVVVYVTIEHEERAMLGPYYDELPWCQVNAFLTRPKDSHLHRVIMDLS